MNCLILSSIHNTNKMQHNTIMTGAAQINGHFKVLNLSGRHGSFGFILL